MARRKKETRITRTAQVDERPVKLTEEDLAQRRQFFIWVGIITVAMMLFIYFFLFN